MDIKIVKLKIRRGSNTERKSKVLDQGELVYMTDTKRIFVGNGVLSGGDVVGSKNHLPLTNVNSLSTLNAEVGDLASVNNIFFQLTGLPSSTIPNWVPLSSSQNIALSSLSASQINPTTITNGLKIVDGLLQTDINSKFFQISANQLSIKTSGIDEREISSSSFGDGISGGSGNKVSLNIDDEFFSFDGGKLTFNIPVNEIISGVDDITITNTDGVLSQTDLDAADYQEFGAFTIDTYGRVSSSESSIYDTLTGFDAINTIHNGSPLQSLSGGIDGITLTTLSALSANPSGSTVIVLSSAGFLVFQGNGTSRQGSGYGRFAIPIYSY